MATWQAASFDPADPRIDLGIQLFNSEEFFECHDVFEDLWSELVGPERPFFQGLIHAAVCLFHFSEGNLGGARKMYFSCVTYLSPFAPAFIGIDTEKLLQDLEHCFAELAAVQHGYPDHLALDQALVPKIVRSC
jgi:predicted metal-dependent hydrolase